MSVLKCSLCRSTIVQTSKDTLEISIQSENQLRLGINCVLINSIKSIFALSLFSSNSPLSPANNPEGYEAVCNLCSRNNQTQFVAKLCQAYPSLKEYIQAKENREAVKSKSLLECEKQLNQKKDECNRFQEDLKRMRIENNRMKNQIKSEEIYKTLIGEDTIIGFQEVKDFKEAIDQVGKIFDEKLKESYSTLIVKCNLSIKEEVTAFVKRIVLDIEDSLTKENYRLTTLQRMYQHQIQELEACTFQNKPAKMILLEAEERQMYVHSYENSIKKAQKYIANLQRLKEDTFDTFPEADDKNKQQKVEPELIIDCKRHEIEQAEKNEE